MHILVMLLGVVAAAMVWYWRIKMVRQAGSEVVDAIGKVQGKYRRGKIRKATLESPIAAIDNPIIAAATLICHFLENTQLAPAQDKVIIKELNQWTDNEQAHEALTYGKWTQTQNVPENKAAKLLFEMLREWLSQNELDDLFHTVDKLRATGLYNFNDTRIAKARRALLNED